MSFDSEGRVCLICGLGVVLAAAAFAQQPARYEATSRVSGTIRVWGSPQMQDLVTLYEHGFQTLHPGVRFENELKSTLTAVPGVYTGRADVGLLGREIWASEIQAFEAVEGHKPKVIDIATGSYDVPKATYALMVFVPAANPIKSLSTVQLERIFGMSEDAARTWGDLGLQGSWATRPIHIYGFSADNDKAQIFNQLIFHKDEQWSCALRQFRNGAGPDADAGALIVQAIASDPDAIGISNVHYATQAVKALPLTTAQHPEPIVPSRENVRTRLYPLTRAVYMVIDESTTRENHAVAEFLRYVLSEQGRDAVIKEGEYLPVPPEIAAQGLREISGK